MNIAHAQQARGKYKMAAGGLAAGMSKGASELLRNAVVVNAAGGKHSATLLFLHGLGDTG